MIREAAIALPLSSNSGWYDYYLNFSVTACFPFHFQVWQAETGTGYHPV
jgi:hypothetical protein